MKIKIVGQKEPRELEDVDHLVVQIGDSYYMKDSADIIKVGGRFYRKKSPLLAVDYKSQYILKKDAVMTAHGLWSLTSDPGLVKVNGKLMLKHMSVQIDGEWYDKNDPDLVYDLGSGARILKKNSVKLDPEYYGPDGYISNKSQGMFTQTFDGRMILTSDSKSIMLASGEIVEYFKRHPALQNGSQVQVFKGFKPGFDGNFERIDFVWTLNQKYAIDNGFQKISDLGFYVHPSHFKVLSEMYEHYRKNIYKIKTEELRKTCNDHLTDKQGENTAEIISPKGFQSFDFRETPNWHPLFFKTAGIKYTFGVELETARGVINESDGRRLKFACVRDGSVTGGEYITPILCGDKGVSQLEGIVNLLRDNVFVDDRCGMHVHVGGAMLRHPENDLSGIETETPFFNRKFSVLAIKLGCQLEDELFDICPPNRSYNTEWGNKYCASIKKYKHINFNNWQALLGDFVHGHSFDREHNVKRELQRYCRGRYKWLNLVNCNSASRHKTIEFRLFAGTTNFDKVYNYLLICLAFVWFVENRPSRILKGKVTLAEVVETALGKKAVDVLDFISKRKKKFK